MSIIDTLITDRTSADVALLRQLNAKGWAAMTDEQRALYLSDQLKGAYKASDLNRVNAAMDYLVGRLKAQGINVPIKRSKIPHKQSSSKRLPEGHNELKWIESTGTQYVDTLFKNNQDTRVVMDVQATSDASSSWVFGGRTSNTSATMGVFWYTNNTAWNADYNGNSQRYAFSTSLGAFDRLKIDYNKNVLTINSLTKTFTAKTFQSTGSLALLAVNTAGVISGWLSAKLYSSQIYDNGTLVRDYIPDMLDSGEVGLYDMVEGKFYPNAGTGVFLAGPRRVELPEGFTQVEYIESSGTQYIDTLVPHSPTSKIVLNADIEFTTVSPSNQIMGFTGNGGCGIGISGSTWWEMSGVPAATANTRYSLEWGVEGTRWHRAVNGTTVSGTRSIIDFTLNMYLLAARGSATSTAATYFCSCKMSGAKITVDGALVRDYITCITAEGEGGLYDLVTNEFYGNAGSGAFTYGDIVEWEPLPDVEVLDDYTWYDSDRPTPAQFAEYLFNVSSVRSALRAALPEIPADMDDFTIAEANNIELVLVNVEQLINNMLSAWVYCAEIYSGEV